MDVVDLCGDDVSDNSCDLHHGSVERPAKRQKHQPSFTHVSDTVDVCDSVSHVSNTVQDATEAVKPAADAAEAESPTLSPEQVRGFARIVPSCDDSHTLSRRLSAAKSSESSEGRQKRVLYRECWHRSSSN